MIQGFFLFSAIGLTMTWYGLSHKKMALALCAEALGRMVLTIVSSCNHSTVQNVL